jgi:hypothetical protein
MVIMASALKRLSLYEDAYGFTISRLYGHVFMGWLALAFVLLFVHILREEKARQFAFRIFISALLFAGIINIMNPEAHIVRQNFQQYVQSGKTKELDTFYLSNLSDDATPALAEQLNSSDKQVAKIAESILASQRERHSSELRNWRSFNVSHTKARNVFLENKDALNEYPYVDW